MNKIILTALIVCISFVSSAQVDNENDTPYFGKHEVRLNAIVLVVGAVEINYEYLLNENSGIGLGGFLAYDEDVKEDIEFFISPYYRYYFGKKYAAGFFLEGFGMLNRTDRDIDFLFEDNYKNFVTDFALGIGLGGKWITKNGFFGEVNYGIARNLFKADESEFDLIGKFGISIGYRF